MVNGWKMKGKPSKGKCGNLVVKPLIKLVLLGSHEKSTSSASATFPKITFVTSQNGDDHLLNGCDVTGTVLKAVCAQGQLILIPVLSGPWITGLAWSSALPLPVLRGDSMFGSLIRLQSTKSQLWKELPIRYASIETWVYYSFQSE